MPFRHERIKLVVMTKHFARLTVEAFQLLEFAVCLGRIVRDPRGLDEIAPLIDERAFVVLLLRGLMDAIQQIGSGAAGDERIVGLCKNPAV